MMLVNWNSFGFGIGIGGVSFGVGASFGIGVASTSIASSIGLSITDQLQIGLQFGSLSTFDIRAITTLISSLGLNNLSPLASSGLGLPLLGASTPLNALNININIGNVNPLGRLGSLAPLGFSPTMGLASPAFPGALGMPLGPFGAGFRPFSGSMLNPEAIMIILLLLALLLAQSRGAQNFNLLPNVAPGGIAPTPRPIINNININVFNGPANLSNITNININIFRRMPIRGRRKVIRLLRRLLRELQRQNRRAEVVRIRVILAQLTRTVVI